MNQFRDDLDDLTAELDATLTTLRSLGPDDWTRSTALAPQGGQAPWTLLHLAAHHVLLMSEIGILLDGPAAPRTAREAGSFYIYPGAEVSPVIHERCLAAADRTGPEQIVARLADTVEGNLARAGPADPATIGPAFFGPMRLDEFVATRVVEAVVHGMDLTDALGHRSHARSAAIGRAADVLDDLLARRSVPGRPADLRDDLDWVRAASGRGPHPDPRLPLIG